MRDIEFRLTANLDDATKEVAGFRKEYADLVKAVEKPLRQVNAFRELESSLEQTGKSMRDARDRVRDLSGELARSDVPTRKLQESYRASVRELQRLERLEATQSLQLGKMSSDLQAAGVDTRKLADEQKRLASEYGKALANGRADSSLSSAKNSLGVGAVRDTQQELVKLRQQYGLVRDSGQLSARDLGIAQANYRKSVSDTLAKLRELRSVSSVPKVDQQAGNQAALSSARSALGADSIRSTQQALVKLREQYVLVRDSGELSARDLGVAQANYRRSVTATLGKLRELRAANADQAQANLASAKSALGAGAVRDTQLELVKLRQQYTLVRDSGQLSARDLGIAQANYRKSVSDTLAKLRELRAASTAPAKAPQPVLADTARETLGINRLKDLRRQLAFLTADYQRLTRSGVLSAEERAVAETQYRRRLLETQKALADLRSEQQKPSPSKSERSGIGETAALVGGGVSALAVAVGYLKTTDAAKKMDAQLKLTTATQSEFNEAQRATFEIAQRNQAPLEDVVTLYSRLQPAMAQMGRGQKDTLSIIDAVTQSLRISGATASETSSTIIQFSQALGSGVLRGEEFNSIAENSPRLLRALAEGLKVPTGALRNMASEGKLTADVIVETLLGQLPKLTAEASQLPETFGGALEKFKNQLLVSTKQVDELTGASSNAVGMVKSLTEAMAKLSSGEFGDSFRSSKQSIGGFNNEISVTLARVRDLQDARRRLRPGDESDTVLFDWKLYSRADIDKELSALDGYIEQTKRARDKLAADLGLSNDQQNQAEAARVEAAQRQSTQLKEVQTRLLADTKKALKEQVKAETAANAELKKAKDAQLETQKRYAKALADLQKGPDKEPSYGAANILKVDARNALAKGDATTAKQKAGTALDMLQKMAESGGNTLGFQGFIKELKAIEEGADRISRTKAEDKLQAVKDKTAALKDEMDKLKDVQITPVLSEDAVAAVVKQMEELKLTLGQQMVVPLKISPTAEQVAIGDPAAGGAVHFPQSALVGGLGTGSNLKDQLLAEIARKDAVSGSGLDRGVNLKDQLLEQIARKDAASKPVGTGTGGDSRSSPTIEVNPVLPDGSIDKLKRDIGSQGAVSIPVQPEFANGQDRLDVPVLTAVDQASVDSTKSQVAAIADQLRQSLVIPVSVVPPSGGASTPAPSSDIPGFATGDMVRGPGTGTSDSILARLSNGEFVMRAAAVQHYGPELLRQINERRLPRFATGGEVSTRSLPSIPAPSQSLLRQIDPPAPEPFASVALTVGGNTYNVNAPRNELDRMLRDQRIKFGNTT
ncbi:tape measure domain-containing protein [Pseudomonas asplenii]|uniref:Tape measure domain-containing protein n=1 Tax=Pseudomonas asplenii TaxID=53407 RepID=A0A1H6P0C8_9PSED|nr:tape measure protein [Pseudomonas fuscovaginae]SEI17226.1 tape measure domain-containing protein [Pseudomonas fuscovaginae]